MGVSGDLGVEGGAFGVGEEALALEAGFAAAFVAVPEDEKEDCGGGGWLVDAGVAVGKGGGNRGGYGVRGGWGWGGDVPNRARDQRTFMPRKAGKRSLRKFMMARSMPAMAPGLVTRSLRLGTLTRMPIFSARPAPWVMYLDLRPCFSAAAASISGPMDCVILEGSCSISFWRKEGRCL